MWMGIVLGALLMAVFGGTAVRHRLAVGCAVVLTGIAMLMVFGSSSTNSQIVKPIVKRGATILDPGKTTHESSLEDRARETSSAWAVAQHHLLLGVGVGAPFGVYVNEPIDTGSFIIGVNDGAAVLPAQPVPLPDPDRGDPRPDRLPGLPRDGRLAGHPPGPARPGDHRPRRRHRDDHDQLRRGDLLHGRRHDGDARAAGRGDRRRHRGPRRRRRHVRAGGGSAASGQGPRVLLACDFHLHYSAMLAGGLGRAGAEVDDADPGPRSRVRRRAGGGAGIPRRGCTPGRSSICSEGGFDRHAGGCRRLP